MSEALPLEGLRVLDISTFIAAPAAAVALADFGADVIKIEAPGEGDPHRHNYKRAGNYPRSDHNFPLQLDGRLKRSLAIDLKKPEVRPILEDLVRRGLVERKHPADDPAPPTAPAARHARSRAPLPHYP